MKWKQLLTPVKSMYSEDLEEFISSHKEGTFTILDVRQPWEYREEHIPGSKLIPLPELIDRLEEIDPEKPTVVYCAVGGRSRVAAQMLAGKGFKEVYNLKGGINAWMGRTAFGPVEQGMALLRGDETPKEIIVLAYGMEEGLKGFYKSMALKVEKEDVRDMFKKLSKVEETHKIQLFELYRNYDDKIKDRSEFEEGVVKDVMEGGLTTEEFLEINKPAMKSIEDVLSIAMMIEAEAMDLYMRYREKVEDEESKNVLLNLAEAEKVHLNSLGKLMDRIAS
ncbi:MAG: sulfurtransferase [Nitrospirae bacterium]|nr:MAG: sulfurtransferase [Nitrospirota bacterium]